jgi:multidrug efflux system outer membrane protein
MKYKFLIILALVIGLISSCAVGPDFKKPEYKANDQYHTENSSDTTLSLKWWNFYEDEVLDTLIFKSLQNNRDLLMAAKRIEQSKANLGMTKADQYPHFNLGANVQGGNYGQGQFTGNTPIYGWGVTPQLQWEIDFWGKFKRSTEASRAELVSSIYGLRSIQMSLISEVAKNYFLLLDFRQRLIIAKKTFQSRDSAQIFIQARFDRGYAPEIDLNQAQIQTAISQSSIPVYERKIAEIQFNLSVLIGQNPDSIITDNVLFNFPIPDTIPAGIPSLLLRRRPDILSAEADLHAQVARIGVAQAMRFPSFSINGGIGIAGNFSLVGLGWNLGASLFGPLFQFNKNKRRMEVEKFKAEEVAFKYEKTVLNAFKEVENNLVGIQKLKEELVARKKHMDAAQNAERLSYERYNKGITSYLEVLETQRQSFQAQLEYSRVYQELLSYYSFLFKSLGGGWLSIEEVKKAEEDNMIFEEYIIPYHDLPPKERRKAEKEARKKAKEEKKKAKQKK